MSSNLHFMWYFNLHICPFRQVAIIPLSPKIYYINFGAIFLCIKLHSKNKVTTESLSNQTLSFLCFHNIPRQSLPLSTTEGTCLTVWMDKFTGPVNSWKFGYTSAHHLTPHSITFWSLFSYGMNILPACIVGIRVKVTSLLCSRLHMCFIRLHT